MNRDVKDVGVAVESLLGAVAMVNVLQAGSARMLKSKVAVYTTRLGKVNKLESFS